MNIFELYADKSRHDELAEIFTYGAQRHPKGLAANFLEKDIWVTEILRLLYDEKLLGEFFTTPDPFADILERLKFTQDQINQQ